MASRASMFVVLGAAVACIFAAGTASSSFAAGFIAGTKPYQRPAGAPVIKKFKRTQKWYAQALHGITKPYPKSLVFLDNQGGWFNPFTRPGMTGKYDLRHWHGK